MQRPSVLILDNVLPDLDGLTVLAEGGAFDPHLPVIFITAWGTSQTAIEAMKRGRSTICTSRSIWPCLNTRCNSHSKPGD